MKKWSSQWTQFIQLRKEAWNQIQDFNGIWTHDLAIPVRCSTNWALKPLTLGAGQLWVRMFPWKKWVLMIYEINHIWTADHLFIFIPFPQFIYDLFHISLTIQDHAQTLEEQLWMGGRREVSIISHGPVTSRDVKLERLFLRESVSTVLQLVVARFAGISAP